MKKTKSKYKYITYPKNIPTRLPRSCRLCSKRFQPTGKKQEVCHRCLNKFHKTYWKFKKALKLHIILKAKKG